MIITLLDLDQIKGFIYAAPTLRAIRGSSSLLADFNDAEEVRQRIADRAGRLIYAGGGSVLAEFDERGYAETFVATERERLATTTCQGASFTAVIEDVPNPEEMGATVLRAQEKLRREKARRAIAHPVPSYFLFRPCQACAARPATVRNRYRNQLVCRTCNARIDWGDPGSRTRQRLLDRFLSESGAAWKGVKVEKAEDLSALAASSRNYIGLIQADGNAMGERLRYLAKTGNELFEAFSRRCREATENALVGALRKAYPAPALYQGAPIFPFELVIAGGDDITVITTADRALEVAIEFCDRFADSMKDFATAARRPRMAVGMSAGVVLARSNHLITLLDDLAGQLLKSAKDRSRRLSRDSLEPTVDCAVVTGSVAEDIKASRTSPSAPNAWLTQRPYTTSELRRLICALQFMKFPGGDCQAFPRNKLYDLSQIPFTGERSSLHYSILRARLDDTDKKPHRQMLHKLAEVGGTITREGDGSWREIPADNLGKPAVGYGRDTNLLDAIELYDFIPEQAGCGQGRREGEPR